jgi:HSP20 family molecular chaperone IbpA
VTGQATRMAPQRFRIAALCWPEDVAAMIADIREAVAARAYQRFESRQWRHGGDLEDWLAAEKELLLTQAPLVTAMGDQVEVLVELGELPPDGLRVGIEPNRLVLSGIAGKTFECGSGPAWFCAVRRRTVFQMLDLPIDVDPLRAQAFVEHAVLRITLPKAEPRQFEARA